MAAPEIVFMFSGQGSQYFQMGKSLYEGNDTFREWMLRLDEVARPVLGESVLAALYASGRGKGDPFDRALLTHPAIFIVEYALAQALMGAGVLPDVVLGTSMGSFAAAAVGGFLDVEDALHAVVRQAMALEECGQPGGMTAVLADPALFGEEFLGGRGELAGINFSTHFVISAKRTELREIEAALRRRSVTFQRLPVMFPFHSQWIDRAKTPFQSFMNTVTHRQGRLPMACCDQTALLDELSDGYFWDVVRRPIRFRETTARLEEGGPRRYVDVGPAGTLATFLKYGLPAGSTSTLHSILTPFGTDRKNFAAVSQSLGH
ncbi:MAG: bacillaene synthase trans-acting acyltransferase [Acidobacteriota bacterium]|jgi:acyl transferase domain-containing protein|nr:bacillaene synthase trans-acting acyltransferase [Acidobacteriota bacterium]